MGVKSSWGSILTAGALYGERKKKKRKRTGKAKTGAASASAPKPSALKPLAAPAPVVDFYASRPWRELRYKALRLNDGRCELCGRSKHDGVMLHVDHIKPRARFPHLELEPTNLQILCADCNIGKGAKDYTDWRA